MCYNVWPELTEPSTHSASWSTKQIFYGTRGIFSILLNASICHHYYIHRRLMLCRTKFWPKSCCFNPILFLGNILGFLNNSLLLHYVVCHSTSQEMEIDILKQKFLFFLLIHCGSALGGWSARQSPAVLLVSCKQPMVKAETLTQL